MMTDSESEPDDIPGDYDSLEGMKERAAALGNPIIPVYIERAKDRIVKRDGGYSIESPDVDGDDAEMLFHFGILAGAALEREFPAPDSTLDSEGESA